MKELTQHQRDLMQLGLCPFCEATIRGWKPPIPTDAWERLKERGIDPGNGHKADCEYKDTVKM